MKYLLKFRRTSRIKVNNLKFMVQELLQNCCDKQYSDITINDIRNNENDILYQIKCAIYYGATQHIYSDYANGIKTLNTSCMRTDILPPKRIKNTEKLELNEVKDYFKELIVI